MPPLKWAGGKRWQVPHLRALVGAASPPAAGRAVLRRPGGHARPDAGAGAAERHQPAPHQLLPLAEAGLVDHAADGERRDALYYRAPRRGSTRCSRPARATPPKRPSLFYYLNRTGYNGLCRFNAAAGSTCRSAGTSASTTGRDFSEYQVGLRGLGVHGGDFEQMPLERRRFRLRRSAVRRRVHRILEGRLRLGRAGADGGVAGRAHGPGRARQTRRRRGSSSCTRSWATSCVPRGAAPHQLHRRPDACPGSSRHPKPLSPRWPAIPAPAAYWSRWFCRPWTRAATRAQDASQLGPAARPGRHMVDAVVEKDGRKFLLSVKWQQVSGTAEQKVPFEVICLIEAMEAGNI